MTITYLILAHNNPLLLNRLIERLDDCDVNFYIHIDKKSKDNFEVLESFSNVHLISKRIDVGWGDISLVETVIMCCRIIAQECGDDTCVVLLSGPDYPVKSKQYIKSYLENNRYNFINGVKIPSERCSWQENGRRRLSCYALRLEARKIASIEPRKFNVNNMKQLLKVGLYKPSRILRALRILFTFPQREHPEYAIPYGGEFWWILQIETIREIIRFVERHPDFMEYHKNTAIPDEMFINTIVYNIVDRNLIKEDSLRFIKWAGTPSPQDVTMEDRDMICRCHDDKDILFMRKVVTEEVRDLIDKMIL